MLASEFGSTSMQNRRDTHLGCHIIRYIGIVEINYLLMTLRHK